jgi:DNA-3-methyladenine glycosylase
VSSRARAVGRAFFDRAPEVVAADIIGCELSYGGAGGLIVEAEAYGQRDPASHSFRGETPRCRAMFGPPGTVYVYRIHGLHWCLNLVTEGAGTGAAVLIRAIEPTHGVDAMRDRRGGVTDDRLLCGGPGRLTQALGITGELDGLPLARAQLHVGRRGPRPDVAAVPRIGISQATQLRWRMVARGSRYLSRPIPRSMAA